jgi:hypothetical protein
MAELCTFCDRPATTRDHVPARAFFARPRPATLITVPACEPCNNLAHTEDDYFRSCVLRHHRVAVVPEAQSQLKSFLASTQRPQSVGFLTKLVADLREIQFLTPGGNVIGTRPGFVVDTERVERTVCRYVRGLYRARVGVRLPLDARVSALSEPEKVFALQPQLAQLAAHPNQHVVQRGVFWFSYEQASDNPVASQWILVFFDEYAVVGFTISGEFRAGTS